MPTHKRDRHEGHTWNKAGSEPASASQKRTKSLDTPPLQSILWHNNLRGPKGPSRRLLSKENSMRTWIQDFMGLMLKINFQRHRAKVISDYLKKTEPKKQSEGKDA